MSSVWGEKIKISVFGESHGVSVGVVIDGLPAGIELDFEKIDMMMARRAPSGLKTGSTKRNEKDLYEIQSGVYGGKTNGFPLAAIIRNTNQNSAVYDKQKGIVRPGHADFTAFLKYGKNADMRGGGHFSGRLTAPLTFAGAVAICLLEQKGIKVGAHILSIHKNFDNSFDYTDVSSSLLEEIKQKDFPVISDSKGEKMKESIREAAKNGDSVGGIIECVVTGLKGGIGELMFGSIESKLSSILFAIPAVKGVEFGAGFKVSEMTGSECNDSYYFENGIVKTRTNNNGGILGGISNGMPIIFKVAVKPTPSIFKEQDAVDVESKTNVRLKLEGRHDSCIVPRAVPVIEAAAALTILDLLLCDGGIGWTS